MAKLLKLRRGTTTQHASFTGAEGELTIDITKDTAVVHDGSTQAGKALLREDLSNLPAGQIDNNDVNASAAIAGTKISPDFGSQNVDTTGNILLDSDSNKLKIGDGEDLQIYHNGSNSRIENATDYLLISSVGNNVIRSNADVLLQPASGEDGIKVIANGSVELYEDNTKRLETTSTGVSVTGDITTTEHISIPDDKQLKLGASDDLIMFHQTSNNNSIIKEQGGGALSIQSNGPSINFYDTANSTSMLIANAGGSVDLYNASTVRLKTASTGVDVTGALNATGDIKTTTGKYRIDNSIYFGEVSSAPSGAESPDGSTEIVNGTIGKDLSLRAYGDIVLGSTNNTYNTVAQFVMPVLGASKHGKCVLKYVTANAGGSASSATKLETSSTGVSVTGALVASGNVTAFSDAKLKTDIHTINDALGIVGKLRGVSYKWLSNGESDIGVIAQEVEAVVPEVVKETQDGIKTVDYGRLVGVLINAVNELKAEVEELKNAKITE